MSQEKITHGLVFFSHTIRRERLDEEERDESADECHGACDPEGACGAFDATAKVLTRMN
jgi:hypothetical protein